MSGGVDRSDQSPSTKLAKPLLGFIIWDWLFSPPILATTPWFIFIFPSSFYFMFGSINENCEANITNKIK